MVGVVSRCLGSAALAAAFAGCQAVHQPYDISQADRDRFVAGLIDVPRPGGPPLVEGLADCTIWKAQFTGDRMSGWKVALAADWGGSYPAFMTGCVDQSISYRNNRVQVHLCARAIGAGGGCNNGGYYWSYTGERPWRVSDDLSNWRNLP